MSKKDERLAGELLERFDQEKARRAVWDNHYDDITRVVSPLDNVFTTVHTPGEKRTENIYDTTAPIALGRYAAFMDSIVTPRNQKWHGIQSTNPDLNKVHAVKIWFDEARDIMFRHRYRPRSNFASQMFEMWRSDGMLGTGGMMVNDIPGFGTQYKTVHLSQLYIVENHVGLIDTVYVTQKLSGKVALERFGEKQLPEKMVDNIEKDVSKKHDFVQYIAPNDDHEEDSLDPEKMKYVSITIAVNEKAIVKRSGFKTFPLPVMREETSVGETYGRSRAMMVLPGIQMLNQMKKADIRMTHKTVDPTLLLRDDGAIKVLDMRPGRGVVGGLDRNGNETVKPFNPGARVDINEVKMQVERDDINRAFLVDLYLMQVEREMTATEVLHRAKEQSAIMSSGTGKKQSEFLSPLLEREMEIIQNQGLLPELPGELIEAGGEWEPVYTNPITRAQRADEALGADQLVRAAFEASNFAPEVIDNLNFREYLEVLQEAGGAPTKVLFSRDDVQDMREARAQAQADQNDIDNLGAQTGAALDAAKTADILQFETAGSA